MKSLGIAASVLAVSVALAAAPAAAGGRHGHGHGHHGSYSGPTSNSNDPYTGVQNPWAYTNCFVWDPKIRYWTWICGPPYPDPRDMPHVER